MLIMSNVEFLLNFAITTLSLLGDRCQYISDNSIVVNGIICTSTELSWLIMMGGFGMNQLITRKPTHFNYKDIVSLPATAKRIQSHHEGKLYNIGPKELMLIKDLLYALKIPFRAVPNGFSYDLVLIKKERNT